MHEYECMHIYMIMGVVDKEGCINPRQLRVWENPRSAHAAPSLICCDPSMAPPLTSLDPYHADKRYPPPPIRLERYAPADLVYTLAALTSSIRLGPYFTAFPSLTTSLKNNTPIYTKSRACTIVPNFVGLKFMVHNGKTFLPVSVSEEMVGHKLGEFSQTRKKFTFRWVELGSCF